MKLYHSLLIFSVVCFTGCSSGGDKSQPAENTATNPLTERDNTPPADEKKGVGLYATKTIQKGEAIAFYKLKIFREKDYQSMRKREFLC